MSAQTHANDYWRAFDDWAMYNRPPGVGQLISDAMNTYNFWLPYATKGDEHLPAWEKAIAQPKARTAYESLTRRQKKTVTDFYGSPIDEKALYNAYKWFGKGSLPKDPNRPQDPEHKMNGVRMWFVWCSFADACLRSAKRIQPKFWDIESRAILIGALHDGVFRERFKVKGFEKSQKGSNAIVRHVCGLEEDELLSEMAKRAKESGLFAF